MISRLKKYLKKRLVKQVIRPVYIKDVESNLLQGKTALISGGNSGIGLGIARKFKECGANVIIIGRNKEKTKKVAKENDFDFITLDFSSAVEEWQKIIKESISNQQIDILVNSAGYHGYDEFGSITEKTWDTVMNANVKSMYFLSQLIAKHMIERNIKGHILNISSASALKPGWTPYEISKRAVNSLTEGFAFKLIGHGIIVNGIAPGPTATPMLNFDGEQDINLSWNGNPSGRVSVVEEIANLAVFQASNLGNGIVGHTTFLTGGSGTICIDK